MIEAAETVQTFLTGRRRADLETDQMLLFALTRAIEIIGEAASRVTEETRASVPSVPWLRIIAMRNRLIHAYFSIDRDILWKTASEEVPALLSLLQTLEPKKQGTGHRN
jgi:uncharacterized protein with HEPN domain